MASGLRAGHGMLRRVSSLLLFVSLTAISVANGCTRNSSGLDYPDALLDAGYLDANSHPAPDAAADDALAQDIGVRILSDAGCPLAGEPDPPGGPCDGMGSLCKHWASLLTDAGNSLAVCSVGACYRGDHCDDQRVPSTCRCGNKKPCEPSQACVSANGQPPECVCIIPR
jgi:hypothetical protein